MKCAVVAIAFLCGLNTYAQVDPDLRISDYAQITVIDSFTSDSGYYVFIPPSIEGRAEVVVFTHGYGALNPMVYGGWLAHLVTNGNVVIYPRYQMGIFSTSTQNFVSNVTQAILDALDDLAEQGTSINADQISLIGHSYGAIISANLAARHRELGLPYVKSALLCEPGTGPFTGGVLESYEAIDSNTLVAIVVGDKDRTVGQKMGLQIYETAKRTPERVLFWQFEDKNGDESIGASNYEPYSYDPVFDNGVTNFTVNRAEKVSRLDRVDKLGYWEIFDTMMTLSTSGTNKFDRITLYSLADLGTWSDGTPVKSMEVRSPQVMGK